jgi:hypothetical protein
VRWNLSIFPVVVGDAGWVGKQFTGRFSQGGEVLFDKICRHNAITHWTRTGQSPRPTGSPPSATKAGACCRSGCRRP